MRHSLEQLRNNLGGDISGRSINVPGPGHSREDRSLCITLSDSHPHGFVHHSFAGDDPLDCLKYIEDALGVSRKPNGHSEERQTGNYVYKDRDGKNYLQVLRHDRHSGEKKYIQRRWADGQWISGAPKPKIPYRLPQLLASNGPIFVCEGEKCADAVASAGFIATTASGGADNGNGNKWTPELNEYFRDRFVYVLPDNDAVGKRHAEHVAKNLGGIAKEIRIVELPGLGNGEDVHDSLGRGNLL
jgi:hypothetical protein